MTIIPTTTTTGLRAVEGALTVNIAHSQGTMMTASLTTEMPQGGEEITTITATDAETTAGGDITTTTTMTLTDAVDGTSLGTGGASRYQER